MKKSFYIIAVLIFFVTGVSRSQIHSEKGSFLCSEKNLLQITICSTPTFEAQNFSETRKMILVK